VLNSDNIAITTESFDYGPWRFTPHWNGAFTAAYFDEQGLYSFGRQAQAIHWDVVQLALALRTVASAAALTPPLERFPALYEAALGEALFARLGIAAASPAENHALLEAIERAVTGTEVGLDRFFFDWAGGRRRGPSPADALYQSDAFASFVTLIGTFAPARGTDHPYWADVEPCSMHIEEVEALWAAIAERDDWAPFHAKIAAIRRMGEALRG
jgi:uncharacterized protein YdiU (UPF0061 family)